MNIDEKDAVKGMDTAAILPRYHNRKRAALATQWKKRNKLNEHPLV
ncbi:MAG: hypothetical protein Q8906_07885 [Bacillota bacterium]|nr:hypothetical protein [Bacillota bacterium]